MAEKQSRIRISLSPGDSSKSKRFNPPLPNLGSTSSLVNNKSNKASLLKKDEAYSIRRNAFEKFLNHKSKPKVKTAEEKDGSEMTSDLLQSKSKIRFFDSFNTTFKIPTNKSGISIFGHKGSLIDKKAHPKKQEIYPEHNHKVTRF